MWLSPLLNIILVSTTAKKANELTFCSRFKVYVLIVLTLTFVFKIIRPIIVFAFRKLSLPQSRKFSTVKQIFPSQANFAQSKKFFTVKKIFQSQGNFSQSMNFSSKKFTWSKKFSTKKGIFYSQGNFPQKELIWSRKFSTNKEIFH